MTTGGQQVANDAAQGMKKLLFAVALSGLVTRTALAHRLDEYLQATILSIEPGTVQATLRLVPGVAVAPQVIARIDTNHDGALSLAEQQHYAQEVLSGIELNEDGQPLRLRVSSAIFPSVDSMKLGTGEIEIALSADLPSWRGQHQLTFANHHLASISVYLVNSLVPRDKQLQLTAQVRNQNQSFYQVSLAEAGSVPLQGYTWSGFGGAYRLGLRHIAEGTDHLLFLLTLLLPAPLLASAGRWKEQASLRHSLVQMLGIVSAFTLGHSSTLALAAFGLIQVPGKPIEILIAVSILVSAMHALRPIFPGRESLIAASFGLIHGLAFASALNELGVTGWYRLISLLGFNLGIETMQLVVVAATLPALLLLSRTPLYAAVRIAGALFAMVAALSWIVERTSNRPGVIGEQVDKFLRHGTMLVCALWACSIVAWMLERQAASRTGQAELR